jgi:hypothetical protein
MYLERKEDLAILYWLKEKFIDTPFVNVVDGFPYENLTIPTISVEAKTVNVSPLELGNRQGILFRVWYIDVFAKNKTQRDEFAYKILHDLENTILVYDYDEGFPPDVIPSVIGGLIPENIRLEIVKVMPQLVEKMHYRAQISFVATNNQSGG